MSKIVIMESLGITDETLARLQKPFQQNVHGCGNAAGKHHVFRLVKVEQFTQLFPGVQHYFGSRIGLLIAAPTDVDAHIFDKIRHSLSHAGGFGEGRTAVIQIDFIHGETTSPAGVSGDLMLLVSV